MSTIAWYRVRQGLNALSAFARPVDIELAAEYLSPELLSLFQQMTRGEQLHSLNVLRAILKDGSADPDLAAAALLHDVGKARYPLAIWQKTVAVLVRVFLPATFSRLSEGDPCRFWSRPFVVFIKHPQWGAELIHDAGGNEITIWLAAHHQDEAQIWSQHPAYSLLMRLQVADNTH